MRITFVTALWLPATGGIEVLTGQMMTELRRRGHEVSMVTTRHDMSLPEREIIDGIEIVRIDTLDAISIRDLPGILRAQRTIWETVRDLRPDVLHGHDGSPALWMYLRAARTARPPLVLTVHSVMSRQFAVTGAALDGLLTMLGEADCITGVSSATIADAVTLVPSIAGRTVVVPNGVARPARRWRPVADDNEELLCIGRLVPQKDFGRALGALRLLVDRRPNVRLTIAGDGEEREMLVETARAFGVDDRVDFLGMVDHSHIPALIDRATVVVLPSRFEGMPLVALEAAWMARPVVASSVPGIEEAIVDGVTGLLVAGDDLALADAIVSLLDDRASARAMGVAARARVEAEFSLATCIDRYEAIYADLAAASPEGRLG
jgi:glycogen(starch) synthase